MNPLRSALKSCDAKEYREADPTRKKKSVSWSTDNEIRVVSASRFLETEHPANESIYGYLKRQHAYRPENLHYAGIKILDRHEFEDAAVAMNVREYSEKMLLEEYAQLGNIVRILSSKADLDDCIHYAPFLQVLSVFEAEIEKRGVDGKAELLIDGNSSIGTDSDDDSIGSVDSEIYSF